MVAQTACNDRVEKRRLTGSHNDEVGLLIATVYNVSALGHSLLGGLRLVGHPLSRKCKD